MKKRTKKKVFESVVRNCNQCGTTLYQGRCINKECKPRKGRARCKVCYFDKTFSGPCCDECKALGFPKKKKQLSDLERFERAKLIGHFLNEFKVYAMDQVMAGSSDSVVDPRDIDFIDAMLEEFKFTKN